MKNYGRSVREQIVRKKEFELRDHVRKLDDQINDFYELGEWKGEY